METLAQGTIAHLTYRAKKNTNHVLIQLCETGSDVWRDVIRIDCDWWNDVISDDRLRADYRLIDDYYLIKYFLDYGHVDYDHE